jgi:heat shock protein HtpX
MTAVGVALLVFYGGAAYLASRFLLSLARNPPNPTTTVAIVVASSLVLGYLNYRFGTTGLLAGLDAVELSPSRAPHLYVRVDHLSTRMGLDSPRLLVANLPQPNAFALGGVGGGALVFDRRLFWLLDPGELDAIVAHELAHLESRDSLVQALAYTLGRTLVGTLSLAALPVTLFVTGVARGLAWIRGRPSTWDASRILWIRSLVEHVVVAVFVGFTLLLRAHSRRREYAADDRAVAVTGDPLALARALRKIQRATESDWGPFGFVYAAEEDHTVLGRLLSTHPPMDDRIARLVERSRRLDGSGRSIPVR